MGNKNAKFWRCRISAIKPAERRQNRITPAFKGVPLVQRRSPPPEPRREWLKATKRRWEVFWASDVAAVVTPADMPALERLHSLCDERERAYRGYRKERLVRGSTGQLVINPLAKAMTAFDVEIRTLKDRFGVSPKLASAWAWSSARPAVPTRLLSAQAAEYGNDQPSGGPTHTHVLVRASQTSLGRAIGSRCSSRRESRFAFLMLRPFRDISSSPPLHVTRLAPGRIVRLRPAPGLVWDLPAIVNSWVLRSTSESRRLAISFARTPVAKNMRMMAALRRRVKSLPGLSVACQRLSTSSGVSKGTGVSSSLGGRILRIGLVSTMPRGSRLSERSSPPSAQKLKKALSPLKRL
jgi:hypothetical protein